MKKPAVPGRKPVGRPKVQLKQDDIQRLAAMGYTDKGVAQVLKISTSTLNNYRVALQEGRTQLESAVLAMQVKKALEGDSAMLKWVGIQRCGQRGQIGLGNPDGTPLEKEKRVIVNL